MFASISTDKVSARAFEESVTFDISNTLGSYESAILTLGDGTTYEFADENTFYTHTYKSAGSFQSYLTLVSGAASVQSNVITLEIRWPDFNNFEIWHVIEKAGGTAAVWMSASIAPQTFGQNVEDNQVRFYHWDFGDGTKISLTPAETDIFGFIIHNYPAGVYELSLTIEHMNGERKTVVKSIDTNDSATPIPKYSVSSFKVNPGESVTFTGEAYDDDGDQPLYYWSFPNSSNVYLGKEFQEITEVFYDPGIYYVRLEVRDDLRGRRVTYIPIYVGDGYENAGVAPVAIAESSARFGSVPFTAEFTGLNSFDPDGDQLSYRWDINDQWVSVEERTKFGANVSYSFRNSGSYFVNLTVTDSDGNQGSDFFLVYVDGIEVNNISFQVEYLGNNSFHFNANNIVGETDPAVDELIWSFGDGNFASSFPSVSNYYQALGDYEVKLTTRRVDGDFQTQSRVISLTESLVPLSGDLVNNFGNNLFNVGESTSFLVNLDSKNGDTSFRWNLGNLEVREGPTVTNLESFIFYQSEPTFVKVLVSDEAGLATQFERIFYPNTPPTISDFNLHYDVNDPAPLKVGIEAWPFVVDSEYNHESYVYDFGDGSDAFASTSGYFEHSYQKAGTYTISVRVVDAMGLSSSFSKNIVVKENQAPLLTDFNINYNSSAPAPQNVGIELWPYASDSDGSITAYEYSISGIDELIVTEEGYIERFFPSAGSYTVSARVQDNKGLWSEPIIKTFTLNQNQEPSFMGLNLYYNELESAPLLVRIAPHETVIDLDGYIVKYIYDLGNGDVVETTNGSIEYTYQIAGNYTISITAIDNLGGKGDTSRSIDVIQNIPPVIEEIYIGNLAMPAPVELHFYGSFGDYDGGISNTYWSLSNGDTFNDTTWKKIVTEPGEYTVTLTVTDNKGAVATKSKAFRVLENIAPVINAVTVTGNQNIAPTNVGFSVDYVDEHGIDSIAWTFDDGTTQLGDAVVKHFEEGGNFNVSVRVVDSGGLSSSLTQNFDVVKNQSPTISNFNIFHDPNSAEPMKIGIEAWPFAADVDGYIKGYNYIYGDGQESGFTTEGYVEHTYSNNGNYTVVVEVFDNFDAKASFNKIFILNINQPPSISTFDIYYPFNRASPTTILFDYGKYASDDDRIASYRVDFGDGTSIRHTELSATHTYQNPGVYNVRVAVVDNKGAESFVDKSVTILTDEKFFCRQIADLRVKCQVNNNAASYITYKWKIDGLDAGVEHEFIHDFAEQGDYRFDLQIKTITNENSTSSSYTLASASQTITVGDFVEPALQSVDNQAPVLTDFDINYSFNRAAPSTVLFDYGKYASDIDGAIDSYKIDLGNGVVKRVAQPKLSYVYNQGGAFNVKISAVDINGVESEVIEKIVVVSSDEKFFCRQIADLRVKCQVNNNAASYITYKWKIDGLDAGVEHEFIHDFAEQGDYRFDLQIKTITNENSTSSSYTLASASQTITVGDFVEPALQSVDNQAPVLTDFDINYSFNRAAPSTVLFDYGKYASDIDGAIDSYKIDLGNGVVKRVAQPKLSYVYNQGGAFNVKISAVDINGVESEVIEKIAIVLTDERYFCRQIDYLRIKCQATNGYTSSTTYLWKVNNTEIGNERELVYDFSEPGEYKLEFVQLNPYANMTKIITVKDFVEPAIQSADNQAPILTQLDVHYLANRTSPTYVTLDYGKYASDPDGAIDSYKVDFGDGHSFRVAEGKKEHYFNKAGTYFAVVTAVDINGVESAPVQQVINILDHQDIDCLQTGSLEITCGTARASNPGDILRWKVESATVGTEKEFTYAVTEQGEYNVSLTITNIHGLVVGDFIKKIFVTDFNQNGSSPADNKPPVISNVDIIYSTNNTAPANITLDYAKYTTDVDGNIDSYRIDFGDGTIVRTRDASFRHKYTKAGSYNVSITALDNHFAEGFIRAKVTVLDGKNVVCKQTGNLLATCEASAKYSISNYVMNWEYESEVIGSGQQVSHSFDSSGEYMITMKLKDAFSGAPLGNFSERVTIGEYVAPAVASSNNSTPEITDFDIIYSINRTAEALVEFDYGKYATDVDGPVDSYRVDFGDGKIIRLSEKSVQHQYANAGTYNVVVSAIDNQGAESSVEKIVTILDSRSAVCKQTGDFEATCEAQFKYSFGHELTWILNDEVIGSDSSVKHIFDSYGDYVLTLKAVDLVTSQIYYYPVKVKIEAFTPIDPELSDLPNESNIKPVISRFDISYEVNNTAPTLVEFDYGKYATDFDGVIDNYRIEFGDGNTIRTTDAKVSHLYANAGTYYPSVTVVDNQGAEGRAEATVTVLNTQDIICRQVEDLLVTCLASRKYESTHTYSLEWIIEGQVVGDQRELSYAFSAPGDYVIEFSSTKLDSGNNTETFQKTVTIEDFAPNLGPTANFTLDKTIITQNELFTADAGSSVDPEGFPLEYVWKYSDGTIDKNFQSYHFFKKPGDHSIELTVTDHTGLSDTKIVNVAVQNDPSLVPYPIITSRDDEIEGALFADSNESWMPEGELTGFLWDLGDGAQYTTPSIEHSYANAGVYTVSLTAYGSNGSSTTVTKEVNIVNPVDPTLLKSSAVVEVTGLDLEGFNPIVNNVEFLISGQNLYSDANSISIHLNDEEVSSSNIIKNGNQVTLNIVLKEGANTISFDALDENRNVIQESYKIIAGSKTLSILVLDSTQAASKDSVVKYRVLRNVGNLPEDSFLFDKELEYSTNINGLVVIQNVPAQKGYVYAVNPLVHMDDQIVLEDASVDIENI